MNIVKLAGIILACAAAAVSAQQRLNKEVLCQETRQVVTILAEEHGERPVWIGKTDSDRDNYMMMVNVKTQSWSLLQLNKEVACLIGSGTGFDFSTKFVQKSKIL